MYGDRFVLDDKGNKIHEGKYRVRKHGLLYIVEDLYYEFEPIWTKDSEWEDEAKANEHCRLLNDDT